MAIYHVMDGHDRILCGAKPIPMRYINIFYARHKLDRGRWCKKCQKKWRTNGEQK